MRATYGCSTDKGKLIKEQTDIYDLEGGYWWDICIAFINYLYINIHAREAKKKRKAQFAKTIYKCLIINKKEMLI